MSKNLEFKKQIVADVADELEKGNTAVFNYSQIDSNEINELRSKLAEVNASLKIVKNTLIKRVFEKLGITLNEDLEGQNAVLIPKGDDFVSTIKVLSDFVKKNEKGEILVGVLDGSFLSKEKVKVLSELPSREELLGKVVGGLVSPIRGFMYTANGVQGNFVRALNAMKVQKGGES
jgi:large subunit ribosomal protein L10